MEEKIKRAASRVKMSFVYFWLLPVFLVIFGETGGAWVGLYAGDVRAAYFAETITILLTALSVPASLKLFFVGAGQEDRCCLHLRCTAFVCAVEWGASGSACHTGGGGIPHLLYGIE